MEKIKDILGLWANNGFLSDRFILFFIRLRERIAGKLDSPGGICVEEEAGPLERRKKILDDEKDKVYEKALRLLAEIRPEYKKHLPKASKRGRKKKATGLSRLLRKKIRLAVWTGTGNVIPFRELNVAKLANLLGMKGYAYRRKRGERKKGEMGWHRDGRFVAKDLYGALEHLEGLEAIDRRQLTIGF